MKSCYSVSRLGTPYFPKVNDYIYAGLDMPLLQNKFFDDEMAHQDSNFCSIKELQSLL